ncbi:helitron_like_N domain-containing protein [Trichonephila clavipes]|nr:helitron_like_N domain-containing protein [Trichonephila clavipes]
MCCPNGKVNLPPPTEPPEPLFTYVAGTTRELKKFLQHIRNYSSCFQRTSFGVANIVRYDNSMPPFKVQGQVYHQIGSFLPVPEQKIYIFLIYFKDNMGAMITNFFIPELNNHDVQELWFQQDDATCHTARAPIDLLKDTFGDRLISRFGPVNWPQDLVI